MERKLSPGDLETAVPAAAYTMKAGYFTGTCASGLPGFLDRLHKRISIDFRLILTSRGMPSDTFPRTNQTYEVSN